jgi:hypothetical protein
MQAKPAFPVAGDDGIVAAASAERARTAFFGVSLTEDHPMFRHARFLPHRRMLAIAICMLTGGAVANAPDTGFRIMSEAEIATHEAKMATLGGAEREAYRNAEYARLRQRAAENGYLMPETPPWVGTDTVAAADTTAEAAPDTATRHKEMRERLQSLLGGLTPQQADGTGPSEGAAAPAQPEPAAQAAPAAAPSGGPSKDADTGTPAPMTGQDDAPANAPAAGSAAGSASTTHPGPALPGGSQPPVAGTAQPAQQIRPAVSPAATAPEAPRGNAPPSAPSMAIPPVKIPPPRPAAASRPGTIAPIAPIPRPEPPRPPEPPARPQAPAQASPPGPSAERPPMDDYREQMRARFEDYMRQRQPGQGPTGSNTPPPARAAVPYPHPRGPGYGPQDFPPGYMPPQYPPAR